MLKAEVRVTFTMVYRGYDIEISRGPPPAAAPASIRGAPICPSCTAAKYRRPIKTRR